MTKEAFEQEILYRLNAQCLRTPSMQPEDVVKFVFQAMLGVGHLLLAREKVTQYIAREMDELLADSTEPMLEILSPAWCRLNLRRAMAANIQPQAIAGLMLTSGCKIPFTRQDVYDCCKRIARSGEYCLKDGGYWTGFWMSNGCRLIPIITGRSIIPPIASFPQIGFPV